LPSLAVARPSVNECFRYFDAEQNISHQVVSRFVCSPSFLNAQTLLVDNKPKAALIPKIDFTPPTFNNLGLLRGAENA